MHDSCIMPVHAMRVCYTEASPTRWDKRHALGPLTSCCCCKRASEHSSLCRSRSFHSCCRCSTCRHCIARHLSTTSMPARRSSGMRRGRDRRPVLEGSSSGKICSQQISGANSSLPNRAHHTLRAGTAFGRRVYLADQASVSAPALEAGAAEDRAHAADALLARHPVRAVVVVTALFTHGRVAGAVLACVG